jgi:hypothetical protein
VSKKPAAEAKKRRATKARASSGGKTPLHNTTAEATDSASENGRRTSTRAKPTPPPPTSKGKAAPAEPEEAEADATMMHLLDKPSRGWCYVYKGELHQKAGRAKVDMATFLKTLTLDLYASTFPREPLPTELLLTEEPIRHKVTKLMSSLCVKMGVDSFDREALEKRLRDPRCPLWHQRDFLKFNVTLSSAKLMSGDNGLLALLTKALGMDTYARLHSKEVVMYWYKHCPRDRKRGGR